MNITLNTISPGYSQYNKNQCKPKPNYTLRNSAINFTGGESKITSKFFEPFTKIYDKISDFLCKTVAKPVLGSKGFGWFAEKIQNTGSFMFQNCLTTGSVITSGIYMQRTLANKDMDKDRKKTLAVNQFLTLILSTAGAYLLDGKLKTWWENVSARFVGLKVSDNNLAKDFKDINKVLNGINKTLKLNPDADVTDIAQKAKNAHNMTEAGHKFLMNTVEEALKEAVEDGEKLKKVGNIKLDKFVEKLVKNGRLNEISDKLSKQIKGIGFLKTMLVFGFVYRYFVPVVVTKPANKLCDMYLAHKKAKNETEKTA